MEYILIETWIYIVVHFNNFNIYIPKKNTMSVKRFIFMNGLKIYYEFFKIFRKFYMTLEYILMWSIGYSLINGWDQSRKLSKSKFDQSGNLTKIWARGSSTPTGSICLEFFSQSFGHGY